MSLESSFTCKESSVSHSKHTFLERMDDIFTFRSEALKKLEMKKKQEVEKIREETRIACDQERKNFIKNDFSKIDISSLGKFQETIGRKGMVRKLLFGMNNDIIENNGSFGPADEQVLSMCDKAGKDTVMCIKIREGKQGYIRMKDVVSLNFRRNLDEVWQHKLKDWSNKDTYVDILSFYNTHVKPFTYAEKGYTKISRKDYENEVRKDIEGIKKVANFDTGFTAYGITTQLGKELASTLAEKISAADIIALGITELMDKNSPEFNSAVLTTILEKAGKEYLLLFPALGDNLLSYGPYQLTKSAVDGKNGGSSMADDRFTGGQTLKVRDITQFPLEDHHKAAYLLALTNVALLVKSIPSEYVVISGKGKRKKKTVYNLQETFLCLLKGDKKENKKAHKDILNLFAGFIAGAHNRQDVAKKGVLNWLIAYSTGHGVSSGGHLSDHIVTKNIPTVINNSNKQTRKNMGGTLSGNREAVLLSLFENQK